MKIKTKVLSRDDGFEKYIKQLIILHYPQSRRVIFETNQNHPSWDEEMCLFQFD